MSYLRVCEKSKRVIVNREDLKNKRFWLRGWKDDLGINNNSSLMDQLVEGIDFNEASNQRGSPKARRKAEQRMLKRMMRIKNCNICEKDFNVMYRVQYDSSNKWVFICRYCLEKV